MLAATLQVEKRNFVQAEGVLVASTNGVIAANGLVMGVGAARDLARRFPEAPALFAQAIRAQGVQVNGLYRYGFVAVEAQRCTIGAFQTKLHWKDRASLELVAYSAERLARWLWKNPGLEVHMNFPGIGLGGLDVQEVQRVLHSILEPFAERVCLYVV